MTTTLLPLGNHTVGTLLAEQATDHPDDVDDVFDRYYAAQPDAGGFDLLDEQFGGSGQHPCPAASNARVLVRFGPVGG